MMTSKMVEILPVKHKLQTPPIRLKTVWLELYTLDKVSAAEHGLICHLARIEN